jgi:Ser/Thr protein kinase RdoA (MazF antagonist)
MAAAEDVDGAAFTAESTRALLRAVCEPVELDWRGAELARLGENAIFVLRRAGAVVRIARSAERAAVAAKEVAVARWLSGLGFPVVRPLGEVTQPRSVAGHPVTYWELIEGPHTPGSSVDIAVFLRRLHGLTAPAELELPALDPFVPIPQRIESARGIAEDDRDFLRWRLAELQSRFRAAAFVLGTTVLHGDAHDGNVMRDSNGNVVIFDLENVAVGPPEWDLSLVATYHDSLGWWTAEEYAAYVEAYGVDVRELPAWRTLRATHELQMTTWLSQQAGDSEVVAAEVRNRIASLRDDSAPRRWSPVVH